MKRTLVIQDFFSIGRTGLSVSIPVLSIMNVEPVAVPINIGPASFDNSLQLDFISFFEKAASSFNNNKIHFDSILFNAPNKKEQYENLFNFIEKSSFIDSFSIVNLCNCKTAALAQALYSSAYIKNINLIIAKCCTFNGLTGCSQADAESIILHQAKSGSGVIIPDFYVSDKKNAVIIFNRILNRFTWIYYKNFSVDMNDFLGMYDLFSAVVTGAVTKGLSLEMAGRIAINFIQLCAEDTFNSPDYNFYGLNFEKKLPELSKLISDNSGI